MQPITVYSFGFTERSGSVFVQTLQQLIDRSYPNSIIDAGTVSGTRFGSVASFTPSTEQALGAIDDAIAGNEDFGGFVEAQIEAHWPTIPDCDRMTEAACKTAIHAAGFHGTITTRTLSASEAVMARDPDKVTATSPAGLTKADPGTPVAVYVNPAIKPSPTLQQRLIANAMKANNPGVVTDANKADIARACEKRVTAKGSSRTIADCITPGIPIYVIGREWPQAAEHTIQALESYAPWVLLTYIDRARTDWYIKHAETGKTTGKCKGKYLQPNPAATACDEWPWQRTEEGGEKPATGRLPHLKIINARQNSLSGGRWDGFLVACAVKVAKAAPTPTNGAGRFLVIPMPKWTPRSFLSQNLCNGVVATA